MGLFERYINKNPRHFEIEFSKGVSLIVVIPVYDDPEIISTLNSLYSCIITTHQKIGILINVNHPETAPEEIKKRNRDISVNVRKYMTSYNHPNIEVNLFETFDLPIKEAGVGAARKLAMDSAVRYFGEEKNPEGIIASLDADTLVEKNYIEEICRFFYTTNYAGAAIGYEHPLDIENTIHRDSIVKYELYLRYYRNGLKFMRHPYAFHCIGSAFAVRVSDYVAVGGMNKKQAGEDFYFIQKLIATHRFATLNTTKVYPSSRLSERTPFGTGQAVKNMMENGGQWPTYNMEAFKDLKLFFDSLDVMYNQPLCGLENLLKVQKQPVKKYLESIDFVKTIDEINRNTASLFYFERRFFDAFNAFRVLKYLNYVHETFYPRHLVLEAARQFFGEIGETLPQNESEALDRFRKKDFAE